MESDMERQLRVVFAETAVRVSGAVPDPSQLRAAAGRSGRDRRSGRAWSPALAAAAMVAVVTLLAAGTVALVRHQPKGAPAVAGRPGVPTLPTMTPLRPEHGKLFGSPGMRPPQCQARHLVPFATGGPAAGTENVTVLLRNVSDQPCWLFGIPEISGVSAKGTITRLPFFPSSDPADTWQFPAGTVAPGGLGAVHLALGLNNCTRPVTPYSRLALKLASGSSIQLPFPTMLALTGCFGDVGTIGPVVTGGCEGRVDVRLTGRQPQQLSPLLPLNVTVTVGDVIDVAASGSCGHTVRGSVLSSPLRSNDGHRYTAVHPGRTQLSLAHPMCQNSQSACQGGLNFDGTVNVTVVSR